MIFQREADDREESLSFCDLPIAKDVNGGGNIAREENGRPPNQDFFEFFNELGDEMSAAEDIFLQWKLLPNMKNERQNRCNFIKKSFFHPRSESSNELHRSRPDVRPERNRFSAEYRKSERPSSSSSNTPTQSLAVQMPRRVPRGRCDSPPERKSPARPKWYLLMFGSMKVPAEMEMKDIRTRQRRRNLSSSATLFPSLDRSRTVSVKTEEDGKRPKKLLRAFSCRDQDAAAVTASLSCMPHV
ncbi:uncharacterized protein LOC131256748 [Magnolia sinica]|uniref:uncharacterized protein LOC131256748 n=1 Tax=Magnolia sinica TaxID=86752 RepID=UPI002659C4BA|nr:uncharacterized protein LOC131256748 [Magnolia sinica]